MTILSDYQKLKTEQKIEKENKLSAAKEYQYNALQQRTKDIPPIVNMKDAYAKVRESKVTINRNYARLTSSSLNV